MSEKTDEEEIKLSATLKYALCYDISLMYKKISDMDEKKIKRCYRWLQYDDNSDTETLQKKLRSCLALIMTKNVGTIYKNENVVPYYVVLDFEATCEAENPANYHHEIIEFPAVLVNSQTLEIEDTFRYICKPTVKNVLSEFCVELTGITQEEIDEALPFSRVLQLFEEWLAKHKLGTERKFAIVTDNPCDVCRFLFVQCIISKVCFPSWASQWVDICVVFRRFYGLQKTFLRQMLGYFGMGFQGRPHCGIDDALNISRILMRVICDGAVLLPNYRISANAKASIMEAVKLKKDLLNLSLEPDYEFIPSKEKLPTLIDVKKARSMRIHALAKISNTENNHETALDEAQSCLEGLKIRSVGSSSYRKKKTKKKKRNF